MKNIPLLIGTIIGTLVFIFAVGFIFSKQATPNSEQAPLDQSLLIGDSRHVKGNPEGQITIVEFSDFQCPACKSAEPFVQQLLTDFPGKIKFVYRHFPLDNIHPNARMAARASEVLSDYGKFWEMHKVLFERQDEWASITDEKQLKDTFGDYAQELEIDKNEFLTKIEDETYADLVQLDSVTGVQVNVKATPTFYVNGSETPAPQLKAVVQSIISNEAL